MNKTRIEALSDGVFSIVMTLLIIDIKVPKIVGEIVTNDILWQKLWELWPLFRSYLISFIILGMYWIAHHALFHLFVRQVNRVFAWLNILFLMFIAFIPFSAHLMGEYPTHQPAIIVYGLNIILSGLTFYVMYRMIVMNPELVHENVTKRLKIQSTIRVLLPPVFAILGIIVSFWSISTSFFLFAFPIFFNAIPGTLDYPEKLLVKLFNSLRRQPTHH